MATFEEFQHRFLPEAIKSDSFGKNVEVLSVFRDEKEGKDQFASSVLFVDIKLKVYGEVKDFPVVCKFQCDSEELRERFNTDLQFYNEVLVYRDILPLFNQNMLTYFPKYYFGKATLDESAKDDIIMIQDLTPDGFKVTDERIFLDVDHCLLAFKKLGEFHGASLKLKNENEPIFKSCVGRLLECRWLESKREYLNHFFGENAKRGVIPLLNDEENSEIIARFFDRLSDVYEIVEDIFSVSDLSVLCHGDFCRNNMIFRYESGTPVDVKFFDPATARYGSPVVDMSFFLFLNTSVEVRRSHFKTDFLKAYLQGVRKTAGDFAPKEEDVWKEFQAKAVYGYLLAAFFLPVMLNHQPIDIDPSITAEERLKAILQYGGEEATTILKESVRDLITWGCIK